MTFLQPVEPGRDPEFSFFILDGFKPMNKREFFPPEFDIFSGPVFPFLYCSLFATIFQPLIV
jgi:hypothetical protein